MKLPSGWAEATAGSARPASSDEREEEPLHRASLRAVGAHSSEKCGLSASARRNQERALAAWPRQRSIMPRWKNLSASRVPSLSACFEYGSASAQRPFRYERPAEHVVAVDARAARAARSARAPATARAGCRGRLEEGDLEVRADSVRREESPDRVRSARIRPQRPFGSPRRDTGRRASRRTAEVGCEPRRAARGGSRPGGVRAPRAPSASASSAYT